MIIPHGVYGFLEQSINFFLVCLILFYHLNLILFLLLNYYN